MFDRGYRRLQNKRIINKRFNYALIDMSHSTEEHKELITKQKHRFVKRHPADCGIPKCLTCHYSKVLKLKSRKDVINQDVLKVNMVDC
jgi:hypothetical protein